MPRPSVTVHYAQSLDGRIATKTGDSQWIGGPASLRLAHQLRTEHEAILVGIGTVLVDNPRLTARLVPGRSPRRVIVDSRLRLPLDSHLVCDGAAPTVVATTDWAPPERVAAVRSRGVEVRLVEADADGRVDLARLLEGLGHDGLRSLLIEGGAGVITSALRQDLVDRLVVCVAPRLIGAGVDAVADLGVSRLAEARAFEQVRFVPLESDVIFEGRLVRAADHA